LKSKKMYQLSIIPTCWKLCQPLNQNSLCQITCSRIFFIFSEFLPWHITLLLSLFFLILNF
jgi:hypothetical protein